MLIKRSLLENLTLLSCSGTIICVLLNYVTNLSPIKGVWFTFYLLILFFGSVSLSFRIIQWFLRLNKPLKFSLEDVAGYYSGVSKFLPPPREREKTQFQEYDTNELSVISTVLERKLVSSWYVHYVSQEISFPFACKQLLDQMIGKAFQICNQIEPKDVFIDTCTILTSHLKEYKKALKRHEKSPSTAVESHYKKSHLIFNSADDKIKAADHCTNILRIILKELVPWEFWDTPHSELLVRILSKKLHNFVDTTLADPMWINDKLLTILEEKNSKQQKTEEDTKELKEIVKEKPSIEVTQEAETLKETQPSQPETTTIESALSTLITKSTAPILQRAITEDISPVQREYDVNRVEEAVGTGSEPVDIKASPILRQRRGRQGRNEVKIYDRIIEGTVKTWENDMDLQCISLGQDLLASLNGEITLSRLWGQESEADSGKSDQALWFGEDDALDMELETPKDIQLSPVKTNSHTTSPTKKEHSPHPTSPMKKEQSPNPTDALLKDLQTTVHQAKSKIGDLQVEIVDVPRATDDEAAGMMEGLLDFGIAGLKKGLRFTGLSDEAQEKSPSHQQRDKEKMENISPPPYAKGNPIEKLLEQPKELITSTVIQKEENGGNSGPHLVKQQRVASQDSLPLQAKPLGLGELPPALPALSDSPEPQYEEAADLSASIAKLRCLLQQRELGPDRSDEGIWWEGAEETRGRTQRHSSRPVDTAALADEYDMNAERNSELGPTSNNMQRLDRLLQRTVTGVFNSIKTAVGAEEQAGRAPPPPRRDWAYVCTSVELNVCGAVARLVGSRRAVSRVDAALDSLDHLPLPHKETKELLPDDFDEWCACRGGAWCACAALAAAGGLLRAHVTYRMATVLFAELAESLITAWLAELTDWLRKRIFSAFEEMAQEPTSTTAAKAELREFNVEHTCDVIVGRLGALQFFGEDTVLESVKLCVSSLSHKEVNKDVIFRVLDLFALHFKNSASLRNPSFDSN